MPETYDPGNQKQTLPGQNFTSPLIPNSVEDRFVLKDEDFFICLQRDRSLNSDTFIPNQGQHHNP